MSMELMVKAMNLKVGNPLRKLVLIKLADNANDKGECWPSYKHISEQCEISKRSVINHIKDLEKAGFLSVKRRRVKADKNTSNIYFLNLSGAGDSLGVVQEIHHRGAGDSLGGSAGDAPKPVTSFNQPLNQAPKNDLKIKSEQFPFEKIRKHWNDSSLKPVRILSSAREDSLRARTKDILKAYPQQKESSIIDMWTGLIDWMSESAFLTNQTDWKKVDIDWILKENNFAKILDGKYENMEVNNV